MTYPKFDASTYEATLIRMIVARAQRDLPELFTSDSAVRRLTMDLMATHCNGCPLMLHEMLIEPLPDFGHDIGGITNCIDRKTGKLTNFFDPRCSMPDTVSDDRLNAHLMIAQQGLKAQP